MPRTDISSFTTKKTDTAVLKSLEQQNINGNDDATVMTAKGLADVALIKMLYGCVRRSL